MPKFQKKNANGAAGTAHEDPTPRNGEVKKKPVKQTVREELNTFSTDGDLVDIWERRMLNPNQRPSLPIRLNTPGIHIRWINLANNGRYQRARYEEGWVPIQREQLKDEREIYGVSFTTEGWVCRGERQQEMLMGIPEAVWVKIRRAKLDEIRRSNKKIKENMQSAGSRHFGDKYDNNRGDSIADTLGNFKGEIRFGSESVSPDAEEEQLVASSIEG